MLGPLPSLPWLAMQNGVLQNIGARLGSAISHTYLHISHYQTESSRRNTCLNLVSSPHLSKTNWTSTCFNESTHSNWPSNMNQNKCYGLTIFIWARRHIYITRKILYTFYILYKYYMYIIYKNYVYISKWHLSIQGNKCHL